MRPSYLINLSTKSLNKYFQNGVPENLTEHYVLPLVNSKGLDLTSVFAECVKFIYDNPGTTVTFYKNALPTGMFWFSGWGDVKTLHWRGKSPSGSYQTVTVGKGVFGKIVYSFIEDHQIDGVNSRSEKALEKYLKFISE